MAISRFLLSSNLNRLSAGLDEHRFNSTEQQSFQGLAKDFLQEEVEKVTAGPVAYSPLKSCLTRTRINAVIELSRAQLYVQSDTLDENRDLAGCSDGRVLDLNTGSMISDGVGSFLSVAPFSSLSMQSIRA